MEKHMQDTLKKLEDRRKKAEKTRQEKRQKINDVAEMSEDAFKKLKKDLELIRSGLAKSDNDVAKALAKELGFEGFLPTDMQSLAELEFKITEAMAEGRAHDVAEGLRELYELASRRKAPKSLLEYMSIIYTSNALSGISTHAVNIEAPIGEFALRVITDITRSIATGNLSQAVNNLLVAVDSVIKSLRELSYGLFGGASVVTVSQQIQRVTAIQGDIKAAKQSLSKGSKSSILQKLKAIYVLGHSISDISRRVLSTYDNVAFTTFHNYLQKTGASELMLRAGMEKAKVLPTVLSMSLRSSDLVSSELSIINDLMSQLDSVGFDPTQSLAILETESSNLGTNRELATFKRDFIGGIRRTVNAFPDPKKLRRKLFREGLHQKNMVYIRAKERTNKDIFDLVRSELEKKMPSAEAEKEVNDIVLGSQRESEFILGYERDEVPAWDPLGFILNVIRTGTQPIVRKYPIFGRMVFGFIMMPINLAERAMWFTPYGLLRLGLNKWGNKSGKFYQQSMGTQHQARQRRTEALAGISFMTLLFSMKLLSDANDDDEFEFVVDGAGPRNKTERDAFLKVGRKPFSFGLRYKDKYYLLNWGRGFFETLKPVFLMVGAVEDMKLNKKTSDSEEFAPLQYLGTLLNGWVSQNSFVGVKNSAGAAFQLDPDAAFVSLGQLMFKATPLIFPLSGFSASLEKLISGNEAYKSGMGAIWSNIPVARSLLTNKAVNALGDPIGANFTNGWAKANDRTWAAGMPFLISGTPTARDQAVYGLIIERGVAPGMPARPAIEDKYGPMEDKVWLDYVAYRGALIKSGIYNRINVLKRMDSEQLQKAFGQISEDATARAKAKFRFVGPPRVK